MRGSSKGKDGAASCSSINGICAGLSPRPRRNFLWSCSDSFPFSPSFPILFGSALAPKTVDHLFGAVTRVMDAFSYRVPTSRLNQFLQKALADNPIPTKKGNPLKSLFITQVSTKPPTFALFAGKSVVINSAYLRYLENQLRATFGFEGTPLRILVRKKNIRSLFAGFRPRATRSFCFGKRTQNHFRPCVAPWVPLPQSRISGLRNSLRSNSSRRPIKIRDRGAATPKAGDVLYLFCSFLTLFRLLFTSFWIYLDTF